MSAKPKIINSFYKMFEHLKGLGLNENDVIYLLQKRTKPKVSIKDIRATIEAIRAFESQINKFTQNREIE